MKVVVADYEFPNLNPDKEALKEISGLELVDAKCTNEDELIAACSDTDGLLNQYNYITPRVIDSMKNCKAISTYGIGVDKINVEAATRKGIYVCNSPEYNQYEVCDHTVMLILALSRQLVQLDRAIHKGVYGVMKIDNALVRPYGQTLGFIGFGRIAKQIAEKMKIFGMKAICYDPFLTAEQCEAGGATKMELDDVMKNADFVSINVSLTEQTRHMIGAHELGLMKPTAYLINCGRGAIVDEAAMVKVLQEKRIYGAALDTFEVEPILPGHPLLDLDNVITTPHSAWNTKESMYSMQYVAARQIALVLQGKKPEHCVNYDAVQKVLKNQ
jgi:D-3-phosphoglycerate dehydrogenase